MRFRSINPLFLLSSLVAVALPATAERFFRSTSLVACQENSGFTASKFDVVFTPNNLTATVRMISTSSIEGHVIFDISIFAYGYPIIETQVNPCDINLAGLCPMVSGKMSEPFNLPVTKDAVSQIPGIAYTFPDLDATVRVFINRTDGEMAGQSVACLEADISNGMTGTCFCSWRRDLGGTEPALT